MSNSTLHVESLGNGPDLVLLHGWGLHGGIFRSVAPQLAAHHRVHLVDLPGHGRSAPLSGAYTLNEMAHAVAAAVPVNAIWLGWSLGGRVALAAAARGTAIAKLILVGTNPCFTRRDDWPHGMPEAEFEQFAASVRDNWEQTLQRFLAIQARGSERAREELRALRQDLFAHGKPQPAALAGALEVLRTVDLRSALPAITQRALVLHGARDTLAPLAAAEYTASRLPHATLHVVDAAGHAPFLSHPGEFMHALETFLHE
jgi:pimeloyl-[acyl-carrier protein] methyl ester esterase